MSNNKRIDTEHSERSKISFKTNRTNKTNLTHFSNKSNQSKKTEITNKTGKPSKSSLLQKIDENPQESNQSANQVKPKQHSNLRKKKDNQTLADIIDEFLIILSIKEIDKLSTVISKLKQYAEKTYKDNTLPEGHEYINEDEDSLAFEKFVTHSKIALNNIKDFGLLIKDIPLIFSLVHNGKWAEVCVSLLIDIITQINDAGFLEAIQKDLINNTKFFLQKSYLTDYPFILNALELFIHEEYFLIVEFVYNKISEEVLSTEINFKLLLKSMVKLHKEEKNLQQIKNSFYLIQTLKVLEFVKKLAANKHLMYTLLVKGVFSVENIQSFSSVFSFAITYFHADNEFYSNPYYQELLFNTAKIILVLLEYINEEAPKSKNKNKKKKAINKIEEKVREEERQKVVFKLKEGLKSITKIASSENELNKSQILATEESQVSKSFSPLKGFFSKLNNIEKPKAKQKSNNYNSNNNNNNNIGGSGGKNDLIEYILNFAFIHVSSKRHLIAHGDKVLAPDLIDFKLKENKNLSLLIKIVINLMALDIAKFFNSKKDLIALLHQMSSIIVHEITEIPEVLEPLFMETFNYCFNFILVRYKKFFMESAVNPAFDYHSMSSFLNNMESKVFLCLEVLNEEGSLFKNVFKYAETQSRKEIPKNYILDSSYEALNNKAVIKLFTRNIDMFIIMGMFARGEKNQKVRELFDKFNDQLNKRDRDSYLIRCLDINSEIIKSRVLEAFLHANPLEIDTNEIKGIISTIDKANIIEMKLERLVGSLFIFILRRFDVSLNKKPEKNPDTNEPEKPDNLHFDNKHIIPLALRILEKSLLRTDLDDATKRTNVEFLNLCILVFLINLSVYQKYQSVFENPEDKKLFCSIFQSIAQNNRQVNDYVPLCLEKCAIGWNVLAMKELVSHEAVYPYSLVSLRIFSHLAEILCNKEFHWIAEVYDHSISPEEIYSEMRKRLQNNEVSMIVEESNIWSSELSKQGDSAQQQSKENQDKEKEKAKKRLLTKNSKLINQTETSIEAELEIKTIKLPSTKQKHQIKLFSSNFKFFLDWLLGLVTFGKSDVNEKLNNSKFDHYLSAFRNKAVNTKTKEMSNFEVINKLLNDNITNDKIIERVISDNIEFVLKSISLNSNDQVDDLELALNQGRGIKDDLINFNMYGTKLENLRKVPAEETIDNPYLRSLVISCFLRCIYSVSLFGDESAKDSLRKDLRDPEVFLRFSLLIDSSTYAFCCIANKYLVICEFVFSKLSYEINDQEKLKDVEKLIEVFSIITSKVFNSSSVVNKKDEVSKDLIRNLVSCFLTITKEIQYMPFQQLVKDILIEKIMNKRIIMLLIETLVNLAIEENKLLTLKKSINSNAKTGFLGKAIEAFDGNLGARSKLNQYNLINFDIPNLLVTFMAIKKENAYNILEIINKFNYLKQICIRKSLQNDILENYKMENFKKALALELGQHVMFLNKCELIDYSQGFHDAVFLLLTENEVRVLEFTDKYLSEEFNIKKDIREITKLNYSFSDFKHLLLMELGNRLFIKIKDNYVSVFFRKYIHAIDFRKDITHRCKNLSIFKSNFKYWLKAENDNDIPESANRVATKQSRNNSADLNNATKTNLNDSFNKGRDRESVVNMTMNSYLGTKGNFNDNNFNSNNLNNKTMINLPTQNNLQKVVGTQQNEANKADNGNLQDFFSTYHANLFIISFEIKSFFNLDNMFLKKKTNKVIPNFKLAVLSHLSFDELNKKYSEVKNKNNNNNENSDLENELKDEEIDEESAKDLFLILFDEDVMKLNVEDLSRNVSEGDTTKLKECYNFVAEYNLCKTSSFAFEVDSGNSIVFNFSIGSSVKLTFYGDWGYFMFKLKTIRFISRIFDLK